MGQHGVVSEELDPDLPFPGPVVLGQKDLLPPPKPEPPPLGGEEEVDPGEEGLQVGVAVPLPVAVLGVEAGGELGEAQEEVMEGVYTLAVPLEVEVGIGEDWLSAKE